MGQMRARFATAAGLLAAVLLSAGPAPAIPNTLIAQCKGSADVGGPVAQCTTTFRIDEPRFPQEVGTHANFHAPTSLGSLQMEWFNQNGKRVAVWMCEAPGMFVHRGTPAGVPVEAGPNDMSSHLCRTRVSDEAFFALGPQTLVVTAKAELCRGEDPRACPFHGYLALKRATEPV